MIVFVLVAAVICVAVAIVFLNRFYIKASRELALVRTGFGGQRVVLDGGVICLPIVHRIAEINMRTVRLEVERTGERSIITQDRLRINVTVVFYLRVEPTADGVATAAQALGGKASRAADLTEVLEGKLVDALLSVASRYTMDALQDKRGDYVAEVAEVLGERVKSNGLMLESVSLTRLDQTPFNMLDQNNAFNAVGMRRLAEVIATNRRERAEIEDKADIAVRQSHLDAAKRRLIIEQEEEQAELARNQQVETYRAIAAAETTEAQAAAEGRRERATIVREASVRSERLLRDRGIRELELQHDLAIAGVKHDVAVQLAAKRIAEATAEIEAHASMAREAEAREDVQKAKELAIAERSRAVALIKVNEETAIDDVRTASRAGTVRLMAAAEADAVELRAKAARSELLSKAEGEAAIISAQNTQSETVLKMRTDLARIETLPSVVREMVRPAEKIESIRINQIHGLGPSTGSGSPTAAGPTNQIVDSILSMALHLPAMRKLGEEIGLNIGEGVDRAISSPSKDAPDDQDRTHA